MSGSDADSGFIIDGGEGTLSMDVLVGLLHAVVEKGKAFRVRAFGFSMHPFIKNRDIITISPLPSGRPRLGDVAAYIHPDTGKLVVHRVIGFSGDLCLIKGDNVPCPDGQMPKACIQGYITRVERDGRDVLLGLGPERYLIALLSRNNLLRSSRFLAHRLVSHITRRSKT